MPAPGSQLGRYELREPIGSGGMATVYKGYDPVLDREIAIKILPVNLAKREIYRKRFTEEARALGRVNHPNLIRIYAVGQEGSTNFYAMELVRGISLRDAIRTRQRLSLEEAMAIFTPFLLGLQSIHKAGIVHRDIKPGNVMIHELGRVILMDFGLARRADRQALTAAGAVLGTPEYMSPEQAKGETADERSDLYSAGVVLYEMLAGMPPFGGKDTLAILRKHVEAMPPPIRKHVENIPADIEAVLERLLAKRPEDRMQSCDALIEALAPYAPDPRDGEHAVKRLVADVQRRILQQTRSLAEGDAVSSVPSSPPLSAPSRTGSRVYPAPSSPSGTQYGFAARPKRNWIPWGAMATAVLAVAVALLALFRQPVGGVEHWREVALRNGGTFVGQYDTSRELPGGDLEITYNIRGGGRRTITTSEIRRDIRWKPRRTFTFAALLVAGAALIVAILVFLQSRRPAPGQSASLSGPPSHPSAMS
jgi:eukaryotic-like serine/threonine-protein kinase